jgi:hypothetical protein
MSIILRSSLIKHHACIGDPIPEEPIEEEPQEEEAVEPSNDIQGRPLCIPMLYKCIMNYVYLLHCYVTI